jgi:hypothetical protein
MSSLPIREYLPIIERKCIPQIIPPARFEVITTMLRRTPLVQTNCIGLERPLGVTDPQVDISFSVDPHIDMKELLTLRYLSEDQMPEGTHSPWARLRRFAEIWQDELFEQIKEIWLEFDATLPIPKIPIPSVFFSLAHEDREHMAWLADRAFPTLLGEPLPPLVTQQLQRGIASLPEGAKIVHLATMLTRKPIAVRILLEILPHQIVPYLDALQWEGNRTLLTNLLQEMCSTVDSLVLAVDLSAMRDRIGEKIGIECLLKQNLYGQPDWTPIVESLARNALCSREEAEVFRHLKPTMYALGNGHEAIVSQNLLHSKERLICCGINHFKLVIQQERLLAKAYLYLIYLTPHE